MAFFSFITDPINELRAIRLGNKAGMAFLAGNYGAAEELNRRALAIMERTFGGIEQTAGYTWNLAQLIDAQGRRSEAVPFCERTLVIWEQALGPEHPDVADCLNLLGTLHHHQGRYDEAEPLYKRALAIREKVLGPEHLDVAQSMLNYASLLSSTGRDAEAATIEIRAKSIRTKHAESDSVE